MTNPLLEMKDVRISFTTSTGVVEAVRGVNMTIYPGQSVACLLYTSPSPRDRTRSRMPSSA